MTTTAIAPLTARAAWKALETHYLIPVIDELSISTLPLLPNETVLG